MKKAAILTMTIPILVVGFCLCASAEDVSSQVVLLEQQAARVQKQIVEAKQQSDTGVDAQVKAIQASIDSLVKQRVQLDSHIAKMEAQIADLKQTASTSLNRQMGQYEQQLNELKQQIAGLVAKKSPKPGEHEAPTSTTAPQPPTQ
jgi:septal ring factor EnvC (AmiA/AmiB activator)